MKIVHLTDLHFHEPVAWHRLLGKRALGAGNLVLRGRARRFGGPPREALVGDVLSLHPDLVVITGDLTTLATAEEFRSARDAISPLLDAVPVAMLAGNHDRYTRGSMRARRMESVFGPWMGGGRWDAEEHLWAGGDVGAAPPALFAVEGLRVVALDTAVPDLASRGRIDRRQLVRLKELLAGEATDTTPGATLLAVHYPLLTPDGEVYRHPSHGLVRVRELVALLRRHPPLAVVHGHVHRWHVVGLRAESGATITVCNGGSSGLADLPGADPGYLVLEIEDGRLVSLGRRRFQGGAYGDQPLELPG